MASDMAVVQADKSMSAIFSRQAVTLIFLNSCKKQCEIYTC